MLFRSLETKRAPAPGAQGRAPQWLPAFFAVRGEKGWRKGQDWSARMWDVAMEMLEEVGRAFGDGALLSSVAAVRPHVKEVWESKVRPL